LVASAALVVIVGDIESLVMTLEIAVSPLVEP